MGWDGMGWDGMGWDGAHQSCGMYESKSSGWYMPREAVWAAAEASLDPLASGLAADQLAAIRQ
jgi:hypothetical protein